MGLDIDAGALLLIQVDAQPDRCRIAALEILHGVGAVSVAWTDDEDEGRAFMAARRAALPSLERHGPVVLDDVAVPIGALGRLINGVQHIADRYDLTIATFGHAGAGNLHPTIVIPPDGLVAVRCAFEEILELALSLGGSITGEHGVGCLKAAWLGRELDARSLAAQHAIKTALDPRNLMNPGKKQAHAMT